jgi:hypothetical protein
MTNEPVTLFQMTHPHTQRTVRYLVVQRGPSLFHSWSVETTQGNRVVGRSVTLESESMDRVQARAANLQRQLRARGYRPPAVSPTIH